MLKIRPFERYVGDDPTIHYIAIRADEAHRKGYISKKPNITPRYPFIEAGITKHDVIRILQESSIGLPSYYTWRSRSGCYFCFFQQKIEWIGLLQHHPDLYEKAMSYEKLDPVTGQRFTWNPEESLQELARPERVEDILTKAGQQYKRDKDSTNLLSILFDDDWDACLICHL